MPPAATPHNTQEFEMTTLSKKKSSMKSPIVLHDHELNVFNSPIELAPAMPVDVLGTTPEVQLNPNLLEAHFYRDKSSTPETTPLQQSFESQVHQLTDSSQTDHETLVQLSGGELEASIQEQLGTNQEVHVVENVGTVVEMSELKSGSNVLTNDFSSLDNSMNRNRDCEPLNDLGPLSDLESIHVLPVALNPLQSSSEEDQTTGSLSLSKTLEPTSTQTASNLLLTEEIVPQVMTDSSEAEFPKVSATEEPVIDPRIQNV